MCKKARFFVTIKLPLIAKPRKDEYVEMEKDVIQTVKLGGYLTNDIDVTEDLISSKSTINQDCFMTNKIIPDLVNNSCSVPYKTSIRNHTPHQNIIVTENKLVAMVWPQSRLGESSRKFIHIRVTYGNNMKRILQALTYTRS